MQTGIHQWLLKNSSGWVFFDVLFYSMPLLYILVFKYLKNLAPITSVIMLLVNWCYVQSYTLYASNSIEGHIAWLLFPLVFIPANNKTFFFLFEGLRYFFLFFIISAGGWKLAQGGLFNLSQMSGILLYQHAQLLTSSPDYWQSHIIVYLIHHQQLSYLLYLSAALLELSFLMGFFTKKYDNLLIMLFGIFLVMNYIIMRIPYFEVCPLLLTLLLKSQNENLLKLSGLTFVDITK